MEETLLLLDLPRLLRLRGKGGVSLEKSQIQTRPSLTAAPWQALSPFPERPLPHQKDWGSDHSAPPIPREIITHLRQGPSSYCT